MLINNGYYYEDKYMFFTFDGVHSSKYNLFIVNKNDLKIENSIGESSEYVSAMFQEGAYYTGTKKVQKTFKRKCAAEGLTLSQYKEMMRWLAQGKRGFLSFDSNPWWGWTVVLDTVSDASIIERNDKLVVEFDVTWKTVGTFLARNMYETYYNNDNEFAATDNNSICNNIYNDTMQSNEYGIPVICRESDFSYAEQINLSELSIGTNLKGARLYFSENSAGLDIIFENGYYIEDKTYNTEISFGTSFGLWNDKGELQVEIFRTNGSDRYDEEKWKGLEFTFPSYTDFIITGISIGSLDIKYSFPKADVYHIQGVNNEHQHINFFTKTNKDTTTDIKILHKPLGASEEKTYVSTSLKPNEEEKFYSYYGESNLVLLNDKIIEQDEQLNSNYQPNGILQLQSIVPVLIKPLRIENGKTYNIDIIFDTSDFNTLLLNDYNYICFTKEESCINNIEYSYDEWNELTYPKRYTTFLFFTDDSMEFKVNVAGEDVYVNSSFSPKSYMWKQTYGNSSISYVSSFNLSDTQKEMLMGMDLENYTCYFGKSNRVTIENNIQNNKFLTVVSCNNL